MSKINLIPEVKQQQIRVQKANTLVFSVAIVVVIVLVAIILLLSSFSLARSQQISSTKKNITKVEQELVPYKELETNVVLLEKSLKEIKQILGGGPKWTKFFAELEKVTPTDIQVTSLNVTGSSIDMGLKGKDVKSIDRFIKSFSSYKVDGKNLFSDISVAGYTSDKGIVTFQAKLTLVSGVLW